MNDERGTYRERTWAPAWVRVVISGACLLGLGASFYEAFQHTAQGAAAIGDDSLSLLGSALVGGGFLLFYVTMTSIFMCRVNWTMSAPAPSRSPGRLPRTRSPVRTGRHAAAVHSARSSSAARRWRRRGGRSRWSLP